MHYSEQFSKKDGVVSHKFSDKLSHAIKKLEDGEYELAISDLEMSKSDEQNKYFNGVLVDIFSKKTGYTFQDCKRWFKREFGEKWLATNPITGQKELEYKSQSKYTIEEMSNLIDRCDQFLRHNLDLNYPTPEEWKGMSAKERSEWKKSFNSNL